VTVDVDDERSVVQATTVLPSAGTARLAAVGTPDRHRRLGASNQR
jgi:hypothetical protein